ncbi:unnamed protein product [Medioppia subpectinata]|uniref:Uncharacterized protein n=1 Tax=Medioppia subpectinata TaxID=1979941 RepID=A0A7R9KUX4_9ACAR|nr:unnamed protein product [Medioppia subpectinata]CAG2109917.1 unnamed protein product [Medioppia subpectinata]
MHWTTVFIALICATNANPAKEERNVEKRLPRPLVGGVLSLIVDAMANIVLTIINTLRDFNYMAETLPAPWGTILAPIAGTGNDTLVKLLNDLYKTLKLIAGGLKMV